MMKNIFLITVLFFTSSCSDNLSDEIQKSQMKQFKKLDTMRLKFTNSAREFAFEELLKKGVRYKEKSTLYLIEAYDITNGSLNLVIIVDNSEYYFQGLHYGNKISISEEPTIEKTTIRAFTTHNYKELSDPLRISSTSYIGSIVKFGNKLTISHYKW